jgi:hypothetical protein
MEVEFRTRRVPGTFWVRAGLSFGDGVQVTPGWRPMLRTRGMVRHWAHRVHPRAGIYVIWMPVPRDS